jgi:predicted Fe-S protein YdhL (DUF1289 family)
VIYRWNLTEKEQRRSVSRACHSRKCMRSNRGEPEVL